MPSSILNSDDGVISGTSGLKSSGGDDGVLVFQSKGTETARITATGNVGIGVVPEAWTLFKVIQFNEQGAVGGTSASSQLFLNTYYDGAYKFIGTGYAQRYYQTTGAHVWETSSASGSADGAITFTERMRITSSGNLLVGATATFGGADAKINAAANGTAGQCFAANNTDTGSASQYVFPIYRNGSLTGGITNTNTATGFATSSDYRLKENIALMTGALAKVQQLKPVIYTWKVDGSAGQGFIAHELQEVVPECVTGEKDATDADGNPIYQGVDTSFLVATLTAAIQELSAKNDALEARIAALEQA